MPDAKHATQGVGGPLEVESPIINSPFHVPRLHWQIERGAQPVKAEGRRPASYYFRVPEHARRGRKSGREQEELFGGAEVGQEEELALFNRLRQWACSRPGRS